MCVWVCTNKHAHINIHMFYILHGVNGVCVIWFVCIFVWVFHILLLQCLSFCFRIHQLTVFGLIWVCLNVCVCDVCSGLCKLVCDTLSIHGIPSYLLSTTRLCTCVYMVWWSVGVAEQRVAFCCVSSYVDRSMLLSRWLEAALDIRGTFGETALFDVGEASTRFVWVCESGWSVWCLVFIYCVCDW